MVNGRCRCCRETFFPLYWPACFLFKKMARSTTFLSLRHTADVRQMGVATGFPPDQSIFWREPSCTPILSVIEEARANEVSSFPPKIHLLIHTYSYASSNLIHFLFLCSCHYFQGVNAIVPSTASLIIQLQIWHVQRSFSQRNKSKFCLNRVLTLDFTE